MLKYTGVRNLNFHKGNHVVRARHLKNYDIVLTTYAVLRDDLYHVDTDAWKNRASKYYKKYLTLPTPLAGMIFKLSFNKIIIFACSPSAFTINGIKIIPLY